MTAAYIQGESYSAKHFGIDVEKKSERMDLGIDKVKKVDMQLK